MKKFAIFLEIAGMAIAMAVLEQLCKNRTKELKEQWAQGKTD